MLAGVGCDTMSFSRKMKRGSVSANQLKYQAADEAMHIVLATCIGILWNDYGKLHRKKTRLKNFMALYKKGLET